MVLFIDLSYNKDQPGAENTEIICQEWIGQLHQGVQDTGVKQDVKLRYKTIDYTLVDHKA